MVGVQNKVKKKMYLSRRESRGAILNFHSVHANVKNKDDFNIVELPLSVKLEWLYFRLP